MRLVIDLQGAQTESRSRGIGRHARALTRAMLSHAGAHDVRVLFNRGLTAGFEDLRRELTKSLPRENFAYFDIPGDTAEFNEANLWRMRAAELAREAFIAEMRPDVVHVSSLFEGINENAVTSIGLMQVPFAVSATLFDLIPMCDPAAYLGNAAAARFYYRRAQSLKRADLLLAISESARREAIEMLSIPPDRIQVSLLAADEGLAAVTLTAEARAMLLSKYRIPGPFIFYVGAIEARKNVTLIIEAFARLPEPVRTKHCLVFGGQLHPPERLRLRSAASRFGVDPAHVIFPGFIEESDLAGLYGLSALFVFPSMHEGFGLPPLEAMACGAPVLAARNSSLPEIVGRDDLLFGTFDAGELAAKMARVLTDTTYADEVRAWGTAQSGRFSWDTTGRKAVEALEQLHERHLAAGRTTVAFGRRPRLAFFSPLPSDQSGVADYSAELLRELGRVYDVECIIKGTHVTDPWLLANFVFRDVDFFKRHSDSYDRIVYCVGNSEFHVHMLELIEAHPGVVILHDFFLSGVHDWLGNVGQRSMEDFLCELYLTHGLPALRYSVEHGRRAAARQFPANRLAFEESLCVIVHSQWAVARAEEVFGPTVREKMVLVPQLRGVLRGTGREQARARLGIGPDDFLVCSFGFVADTKLSQKVFEAWQRTKAARTAGALLAFVGENICDPYGDRLHASITEAAHSVQAVITGFADPARYTDYLAAADLAVQLRTRSRGETSRALLDCMAAGVPVIVNAHGTAAELPSNSVTMLPDVVDVPRLASAMDALYADPAQRRALGVAGLRHVQTVHNPHTVGDAIIEAIERASLASEQARQRQTMAGLRELYAPVYPSESDLRGVSSLLAGLGRRVRLRRILFDVTLLAEADAHTGIERVVRSVLAYLIDNPPSGHVVEPVRIEGGSLRFARRFVSQRLGIPADVLPDSPVDHDAGDIYVALEWAADRLPLLAGWLERFRQDGGRVVIGINDLLPMIMPHRFPPGIGTMAERWFETVLLCADQLICISRSVADDVLRFGNMLSEGRNAPIGVDWYHLGSELSSSIPTMGLPVEARSILVEIQRRPTFLMVGTVEPRKGHTQVLRAFTRLWSQGLDAGLVIVGKQGWMVEAVERLVSSSPENGKRLLWLRGISDEFLEKIYESSAALIAASEGEGFGLPLVEAMRHDLPIVARDIPVFREVAGTHASYFDTTSPDALADVLRSWLASARQSGVRTSTGLKPLSWQDSGEQFVRALFATEHYGRIS